MCGRTQPGAESAARRGSLGVQELSSRGRVRFAGVVPAPRPRQQAGSAHNGRQAGSTSREGAHPTPGTRIRQRLHPRFAGVVPAPRPLLGAPSAHNDGGVGQTHLTTSKAGTFEPGCGPVQAVSSSSSPASSRCTNAPCTASSSSSGASPSRWTDSAASRWTNAPCTSASSS